MALYCCSCFIYSPKLKIIPTDNSMIATVSATTIFYLNQFDSCRYQPQLYIFCKKCWKNISEKKSPKYRIFHKLPQLCSQNYFLALENLSIAQKIIIARAHLIITILKLRPNNKFNPGSYRKIRDHAIILPQNPWLLLILLLFNLIVIEYIMRIV